MLLRMFSEDPMQPNPLGCWIRPLGLEPRTLHSDPFPGDSDPQQSYRSTCNEEGWGMEWSCPEWGKCQKRGRSQVRGRCRPQAHTFLPLSCFSSQPGLTTPPGVGCREKLLERGKGVLLPIVVLSRAALQKEGPESGQ